MSTDGAVSILAGYASTEALNPSVPDRLVHVSAGTCAPAPAKPSAPLRRDPDAEELEIIRAAIRRATGIYLVKHGLTARLAAHVEDLESDLFIVVLDFWRRRFCYAVTGGSAESAINAAVWPIVTNRLQGITLNYSSVVRHSRWAFQQGRGPRADLSVDAEPIPDLEPAAPHLLAGVEFRAAVRKRMLQISGWMNRKIRWWKGITIGPGVRKRTLRRIATWWPGVELFAGVDQGEVAARDGIPLKLVYRGSELLKRFLRRDPVIVALTQEQPDRAEDFALCLHQLAGVASSLARQVHREKRLDLLDPGREVQAPPVDPRPAGPRAPRWQWWERMTWILDDLDTPGRAQQPPPPKKVLTEAELAARRERRRLAKEERDRLAAEAASLRRSQWLKAGFAAKKARGEPCGGAPYGYRVVGPRGAGVLVENVDEQALLAAIKELRGEGLTYKAIAAELARRGMHGRRMKGGRRPPSCVSVGKLLMTTEERAHRVAAWPRKTADEGTRETEQGNQATAPQKGSLKHLRGSAPYGYTASHEGGRPILVMNPDEQTLLAVIAQLRGNGATYAAVAAELEQHGYRGRPLKGVRRPLTEGAVRKLILSTEQRAARVALWSRPAPAAR